MSCSPAIQEPDQFRISGERHGADGDPKGNFSFHQMFCPVVFEHVESPVFVSLLTITTRR